MSYLWFECHFSFLNYIYCNSPSITHPKKNQLSCMLYFRFNGTVILFCFKIDTLPLIYIFPFTPCKRKFEYERKVNCIMRAWFVVIELSLNIWTSSNFIKDIDWNCDKFEKQAWYFFEIAVCVCDRFCCCIDWNCDRFCVL